MIIKFQGLNVEKKKVDSFEINNCLTFQNKTENINSFKNFYLTFDSIYYYSTSFQIVFQLDFSSKLFKKFDLPEEFQILSLSCDSNYLWILQQNKVSNKLELSKISGNTLIDRITLLDNFDNKNWNNLQLISTDINTYVFENDSNGLKLKYNIKSCNSENSNTDTEIKLNESSTCSFPLNKTLLSDRVEHFASGKEHILFLTRKLYSIGIGLKGQLGNGKIENIFDKPFMLDDLGDLRLIDCGGWHSGAFNSNGNCFLWGWNSSGQIGTCDKNDQDSVFVAYPNKLKIYDDFGDENKNLKFRNLSLGSRHSALISQDNNLYTFGWNKYNQLFQSDIYQEKDETQTIEEPTIVDEYENRVRDVKCGTWFTLILLD